jgi:DNA-binding response OmpR family regulator
LECPLAILQLINVGHIRANSRTNAYELRWGGLVVPLQRIPLELPCLLVERRGQLVTRAEILERVWGKGVFVDSEASINTRYESSGGLCATIPRRRDSC